MTSIRIFGQRLLSLFYKRSLEQRLKEEIQTHLDMQTEENLRQGMTVEEARFAALRKFGGVEQVKEEYRQKRGLPFIESIVHDIRYAARMLRHSPTFALIAIVTLGLGIGVNTALFSVVNAVLLQPLPYHNANDLFAVFFTNKMDSRWPVSAATFLELRKSNTVFTDIAALSNKGWAANLSGYGEPERLQGYQVSANLFQVLGVAPQAGRPFSDEEDRPGAGHVVVISHELWQRRFGGDTGTIGKTINLNGDSYSVVGIMPADFRFLMKTDLWVPIAFTATEANDNDSNYLEVIARRRPGVSISQVRAEVEESAKRRTDNPNSEVRASAIPFHTILIEDVKPILLILFGAVGFVLLIACANVANLQLARSSVRRRELAIRSALGAGRSRVVRQLLIESAMLATIGSLVGLLLARWTIKFLVSGLPQYLADANSRIAFLELNSTALAFTFALSFFTTILFGLIPALHLSRFNLNLALKEGGRNDTVGRQQSRLRSVFVVAEIALAMVLLVGAGLMVKSFWRLSHTNTGFDPGGVLSARIDPSGARYKGIDQLIAFDEQLIERLEGVPGVSRVGMINSLGSSWPFSIDEHSPIPDDQRPLATSNQVSPNYFAAMRIPLLAGRVFTARDVKGSSPVVLIDESLARRYFPDENPIGKHIRIEKTSREIVGVLGATLYGSIADEPYPRMYLPFQQENWGSMTLAIRATSGDPSRLIPIVRGELAEIDNQQPIYSFSSMEDSVAAWVAPQRFSTHLLTYFAVLAALLAAIGIYGVISYTVTQRTQEIGLRIALGAKTGQILRLVIGKGMFLALSGISIGFVGAVLLTRLMKSLLFGVSATDPVTFGVTSLALVLIAVFACYVPARRAAKVDPMEALRCE